MLLDPLSLLCGAGIAVLLAIICLRFLLLRERAHNTHTYTQTEMQLKMSQESIAALEQQLQLAKQTYNETQQKLQHESLARVAAETQAHQIPALLTQVERLQQDLNQVRNRATELDVTLEQERKKTQEKLVLLNEAEQKLMASFKALSADALAQNNQSFLHLAQSTLSKHQEKAQMELESREKAIAELLTPVRESLTGVNEKLGEIEKARLGAYEVLRHQVHDLVASQKELRTETANLVKALRAPSIRGRWGEMQLRRVVEITGLSAHCDFEEQAHMETSEGRLRPDMIIHLPGGKHIVIDSKVPLAAYLDALEATEETKRQDFLRAHARHVHNHITALSSRAYWDQFPTNASPEFVVMFLPGDTFFSAALEYEPSLIEIGVEKKVILTTPASLIALLHTVAYGWRQERLAENAREISELGRELHKRLSDMGSHLTKLGHDIGGLVRTYNKAVGSIEGRVLPSARRFKDLDAHSSRHEIPSLPTIDVTPRELQAPELLAANTSEELSVATEELMSS